MPPTRRTKDGLLARVNFPLYTLQMLTNRHILVAGGGGSSKTGVANGFEIFEISHDGKKFVAEEVIRHETGPSVVMNCASYSDKRYSYLVAGQESHCQVYQVKSIVVNEKDDDTNDAAAAGADTDNNTEDADKQKHENNDTTATIKTTRKRRNSHKKSSSPAKTDKKSPNKQVDKSSEKNNNINSDKRRLKFVIQALDSIQTDFLKSEKNAGKGGGSGGGGGDVEPPIQRVVRFNTAGTMMATGGTDSIVRLWHFPSLKPGPVLKGHTKEIDDLDFSPCEDNWLITVAKDGQAILWDYKTGKQIQKLLWSHNQPEGVKYLYKRCRFGRVENQKFSALYTLANPLSRGSKQKGFLQMWWPSDTTLENGLKRATIIDENLSALAVRDDGRFVAVGTMFTGSVSIYIAFSLQRVLHIPGAHSMFVTGLEFLPVCDNHTVSAVTEAAVLSISVDNRVCIHSLDYRVSVPAWLAIILIVITLFLSFLFCSYLGI